MSEPGKPSLRVGVDIGGTFTDLVFLAPNGRLEKRKVPSTPDDYAKAILDGLDRHLAESETLSGEQVGEIVHATTVATNAILQRQGARTALITTKGFRDVLELRRIRIPLSYDLGWEKPVPLVERALRFEVPERMDASGKVLEALDLQALEPIIEALKSEEIEAVAVCLLHSYRNPVHEQRIGHVLRERLEGVHVSLSCEVLREMLEFERTSTTVVNAYVAPLIGRYVEVLRDRLRGHGMGAPLLVMQSNGGLVPAMTATQRPVTIIESGPAAGVVAAARAAQDAGHPNIITLDMGGTTTKASIIEKGEMLRANEYEVGTDLSASSRLMRGSGYLLRIPVIDISEVGAGGGSIAGVDVGGALRVGPRSAGAVPGPACYDQGNDQPTVTDANLVLGYLHPGSLAGGALTIDGSLAERAVRDAVAEPAGLSLPDAAFGIHTVANSNMVRAIKSVSVERGRDPADFTLMAFGGAGPIHAAGVAQALGIRQVLIPPSPGLFSAFGLLRAEVEHHGARSVLVRTDKADLDAIRAVFDEMRAEMAAQALSEGFRDSAISWACFVDLRYAGQSSEITVPLRDGVITEASLRAAEAAFEEDYQRTYAHSGHQKLYELVNCRVTATINRGAGHQSVWPFEQESSDAVACRNVYFGGANDPVRTPILTRTMLTEEARPGPAIIEEYDSTIVVPPGDHVRRDGDWNVVIEIGPGDDTVRA